MSNKLKIIVAGSKGRMGSTVARLVRASDDLILTGEAEADLPLEKVIDKGDVVIDFTIHNAAAENAIIASRFKKPIIVGTTGLTPEEEEKIKTASRIVPVVYSSNMSVGVNLLWKLIEKTAKTLPQQFKVEITETHHIKKLDKPSGTAKKMRDAILSQGGFDEKEIPISSIRKGDVVGDHTIRFISNGELLEITHRAFTRDIFAEGAIKAARWIVGKPPGLYSMGDVLNL